MKPYSLWAAVIGGVVAARVELFRELAGHFRSLVEFPAEAVEQSSFLIDRLVERS